MHDHLIDEPLRRALQHEADALPFTITTAELERRQALRRRSRHDRRLTGVAAGIGIIAVGTALVFGGGWLRLPGVGLTPTESPSAFPSTVPQPSASAVPSDSVAPSPAGTVDPARVPPDLGTAHDPVVVRSVDDGGRRLLTVTVLEAPERNLEVGRFPIPTCCSLIDAEALLGPTGYLAIPRSTEDDDPTRPGVFVYDLATFEAPPLYFEGGSGGFAWAPDGRLAILDAETITVLDPATGATLTTLTVPAGVIIASDLSDHGVWAADGSGLLAGRVGVAATERGVLGTDGTFTADPAPAVFAPTGRERLFDGGGRELTLGCDSSAAGAPEILCTLSADPGGGQFDGMYDGDDVRDFVWTVDGRAVWLVTGDADAGAVDRQRVRRGIAEPFADVTTLTVDSPASISSRALWGLSADDRVLAINGGLGPEAREAMTHVLDLDTGDEWGHSGAFAGWASSSDAVYDPPSP